MEAPYDITISLISYNQRRYLESLLPTLLPAAEAARAEVLLVANRCTDGTAEFVAANFPGVKLTPNPHRAGYGENHNLNLRQAHGRYFVIMNTDMVVNDATIFVRLKEYLDARPDVGIVTPKILNADGTIQGLNKRYPTVLDLLLRRCLPSFLLPLFRRRLDYYEMRDVGYDTEYEPEYASGAFMFCRTEVVRSLEGFDTGFFLYFEDVDLCRRVQQRYRVVYYPFTSIIHFWERAAHKDFAYTKYFVRSGIRYFRKWGLKLA